jgi:hypothetical protein
MVNKFELTDEQKQTEITGRIFNLDEEYDQEEVDKFTESLEWKVTDFGGTKMNFLVSKSSLKEVK